MSDREEKPKVKLTTIYLQTAKSGVEYFSGTMGAVRLIGFENKWKGKNGERSWNIYAVEREKRPDGQVQTPDDSDF